MAAAHAHSEIVSHYRPLEALIPPGWQSGSVEMRDGARIHYTRSGGGKTPLLLLHGVQVSGLSWLRTARALMVDYDVIMPDFRGHGLSSRIENGLSADMLVSDSIALITALKLEAPFVVGHSMGADIAGRLAAAQPLRAAALVDPALQNLLAMMPPMGDALPPWMTAIVETARALPAMSHSERMAAWLRLLPPGAPLWDELDYVPFVEGQGQFDWTFFRHAAALGYLFEDTEVIARIICPVLLLTASLSPMPGADPAPGLAAFAQHLRDGSLVKVENSGHFIMFDQFEVFISTLRAFLSAH